MMQFGLVGIGAGAAAALLFASVASGSLLSVVLFYLAPLPVMIAGLGWSHWAALLAGVVGSLAVAAAFGGVLCLTFVAGVGAPAWWLCYQSALARPVPAASEGGQPSLEWYPPGRLVLWGALAGAVLAWLSFATGRFSGPGYAAPSGTTPGIRAASKTRDCSEPTSTAVAAAAGLEVEGSSTCERNCERTKNPDFGRASMSPRFSSSR